MFGYNSDYGTLSNSYSSQGYGSYDHFTMSMFQGSDHYPYNWYSTVSPDGRMSMHSFHGSDHHQKYYRRINVIMKAGRRPRRQFNISNFYFTETGQGSRYGCKSSLDLSTNSYQYFGGSSHAPGSNNYGSGCYNQRTKTLVLYYATSNGASQGDFYIYRGTKDLMSEIECPKVEDFFDNCTISKQRSNDATNWGYSSLNYNVNLVMGDNDHVGVNIRQSSNNMYRSFDCTTTTMNNTSMSYYSTRNEGQTTSYGPEQGMHYRARMVLSWDTEWAGLYSPYYYYGCGATIYFCSTLDPRRMVHMQWSQSNQGGILTPSGRNGFKIFHGANTDGQPIQSWGCELGETSHDPTQNFNYYTNDQGYNDSIRSISNFSGTMSNSFASYTFQYPGYHYSTSYPRFANVSWWENKNGYVETSS